jgi:hypothetical protein|tara:strand:+ start:319 stop:588 length:270 start_codon:yes stop_codon:yes gene_type:complete
MHLGEYVRGLPRGDKQPFRLKMAEAHKCSVALIRKWENWPPPEDWGKEKVSQRACKHPCDLESVLITEQLTENNVMRSDLRPEIWGTTE